MGDGMGNSLSSEHRHFLQLLHCLLKSKGLSYTQGQIEDFIETIIQFNPWFPEHGILDPDSWKQIGENVKRAHQRGKSISIHFFGMWSSIHYCLGPLADPSKEAHESSLLENNKEDNKKDNKKDIKEEEKPHPKKHVKFKFSSMEDSAPSYAGLYPSLAPFQIDPQTSAIPKVRTKWRKESEEVSLEKTFRQLLLEDGNNDPSPPPFVLLSSEDPLALPVILGPQGQ
jgi:hypothetical protein